MRVGVSFLGVLGAGIALFACGPGSGAPTPRPPNLLLITVDTLRADHLGAYGYPEPATPEIDALAERALVFERALAASSRTSPSHASILTSRFVRDHSVRHHNGATRLAGGPETLAERLAAAGYATAAFVSNSMLQRRIGLDRGFETYDDELPQRERNRPVSERRGHLSAKRAMEWLESAPSPWFVWLQFNEPHGPYTPPPKRLEGLSGPALPGMPAGDAPLEVLRAQRGWRGLPSYQRLPGPSTPSRYRALYAAEIRQSDVWIGNTVRAAEAASDGALALLITADHGESMGEEGFYFSHGHATTPELIRVPMLLLAPGVEAARVDALAHHVDVAPTLLALAGVAPDPASAGIPLPDLARGVGAQRVVFADVGSETSAYRGELFERVRVSGDLGNTPEGQRATYRWSGNAWQPAPSDGELSAALDAYLSRESDPAPARDFAADEIERLKALGYVEPDGAPSPDAN